ncbi:hypothetical protein PG996_011887 [Apiospora saccharicola]|uniref:C2H2-type domain-containing protein n=1 Tax=Apiospora saccharicola TaxID=335842 RepID=A0ABR1UIQ7_9PEZI
MRAFIAFLMVVNYWHQRYPEQDIHDSSDSVGQYRTAEEIADDQSPGYINSLPAPQPTRYEAPPLLSPTAPTSGGGYTFDLLNRRYGGDPARPTPAMPSSYAATPPPPPSVFQYGGGGHDHPLGGQFHTVAPGPPQAGFLGYHAANPASAGVYGQPAPPPYPASFVPSYRESNWAQSDYAKRRRRRPEEIERIYQCGWHGCAKGYGTLNHLNAHVMMQGHGEKRTPDVWKGILKQRRERRKEEKRQARQMMIDAEKAEAARQRWRQRMIDAEKAEAARRRSRDDDGDDVCGGHRNPFA